jgi:hypothetical protein
VTCLHKNKLGRWRVLRHAQALDSHWEVAAI